ncbi:MAG: acetyl-CoA carboxylase biotin carboxyl carrier protein [Alphaproteobacteria bacterium]|nr:acetyl-CoA carboxylase biotin carboxyl carrier protein [Alphaproteobacteria bacterium]
MKRMSIDEDAIRRLAQILVETDLTEIEISEKDSRIRVARTPAPVQAMAAPMAMAAPAAAVAAAASAAPAGTAAAPAGGIDPSHPGLVKSPMVGVCYLRPDPNSPDFVKLGDAVTTGQTVCLIEAMKVYNQIKAHKSGTVREIHVANGEPVEYGQPIMLID